MYYSPVNAGGKWSGKIIQIALVAILFLTAAPTAHKYLKQAKQNALQERALENIIVPQTATELPTFKTDSKEKTKTYNINVKRATIQKLLKDYLLKDSYVITKETNDEVIAEKDKLVLQIKFQNPNSKKNTTYRISVKGKK